ncbi:hypothetical protein Tco_0701070 [Tanacetum coccineum]
MEVSREGYWNWLQCQIQDSNEPEQLFLAYSYQLWGWSGYSVDPPNRQTDPGYGGSFDPWSAKVTTIEESKDLSSLALDELIGNHKVHEVIMEKDFLIYKGKKERVKSIALKAKKESSDDETSTSRNDNEEYAMVIRNFKKFFKRKGGFVRQPREEKKSF